MNAKRDKHNSVVEATALVTKLPFLWRDPGNEFWTNMC